MSRKAAAEVLPNYNLAVSCDSNGLEATKLGKGFLESFLRSRIGAGHLAKKRIIGEAKRLQKSLFVPPA
jgi:hypothetical protein